jgi:1-acyl-sn-glycerol-3-phosphate acyltransferase
MSITEWVVNNAIKGGTRIICRIDYEELAKIPTQGPLIIVANHINSLDVPLMITHLQPRPITGLAKVETWDNPIHNFLFTMWKAIPIRRGEADMQAFRQAKEALENKQILVIAPEGTRSGSGQLQTGKPGLAMLAGMSKAPILPLAIYGGEKLSENMRRLKRTDFHIRVGDIYQLVENIDIRDKEVRQLITDEVMYKIAELLPEPYRGVYSSPYLTYQYLKKLSPGTE